MTRIRSEDDFLGLIDRHFPRDHAGITVPRGDDAAVFACPQHLCLTTDLFVEDVHFRRSYFPPEAIGHKALAVNISDVAAMGARPAGFALALTTPPDADRDFWDRLLAGMAALAERFDLPLVGGDISRGQSVSLAITVWGTPGPSGRFLTRATGAAGDVLCVVGPLGLARVGLAVLEQPQRLSPADWPRSVAAHLRPEPQVEAGLTLAAISGVTAAMDVSDGLARDLPRLLPPGCGARLALPRAAIDPELHRYAASLGREPAVEALLGGEDYALLASVRPESWPEVHRVLPLAVAIGTVGTEPGHTLDGTPFTEHGFDHFG